MPTVDRIVELHASGMERYGGGAFHADRDCLDSARNSAITAVLYSTDDESPDPLQCAIRLFAHLNKGHCFTDGVKRASWMSLLDALQMQGLTIDCGHEHAVEFVRAHAAGTGLQIDEIQHWVLPRIAALPPPLGPSS